MRNLCEDPDTVSGLTLRILSCSVVKMFHDRQRITYQLMTLLSLYINDSPDPAVIMLKGRVIQAPALYGSESFCHDRTSR